MACKDRVKAAIDIPSRDLWRASYLQMKRTYRVRISSANYSFIQSANNTFKAAWKIINGHQAKQVSYEINTCVIDMVEDVVNNLSNDRTEDLEEGPTHDGVCLEAWRKFDSNQVIRVVKEFQDKN